MTGSVVAPHIFSFLVPQLYFDLFPQNSLDPFSYSLLGFCEAYLIIFCRLLNKSYVIEKNFVTVQPIEMTWTMNGDNRENDSVDMKSLEAAATLNGEDKHLMHSSEVTIAPKTLSGTKNSDGENSVYCQVCGLHRSVLEFV